MNLEELCERLRDEYTLERGCGVIKLQIPEWENIYFVVPPPPPKKVEIGLLPHKQISEALRVLSKLPSIEEMSELDKLIQYLFIRREAVQSSRMEGTWSTIDHALTPGELVDAYQGKNEHQAIRSYALLIEEIVSEAKTKKEEIFTLELIKLIQKRIVENDPKSKGIPGKLRTVGEAGSIVTIGGGTRKENSVYNPAPATEVARCLEDVLVWLRDKDLAEAGDAGSGLTLPVRLAIIHAHFEAIHPFTDGNGRAGRALWPLQMICSGHMPLYLSGFVEVNKENYGIALQAAQKKLNYTLLIEFICQAIIESELETRKTKDAILNLEKEWQVRSGFREKSTAKRALNLLLNYPIITSNLLEKKLNVKSTTADDAIKSLLEKKIIRYRSTENRNRVYAAEEIIQIISRPFGEEVGISLEKARSLFEN